MTGPEVLRLPRSRAELDAVAARCHAMVTRRALVSAGAVLVPLPLPGLDIAADVALLTQLIPAINREFGLTPAQIDELNPMMKVLVYKSIVAFGGAKVGRLITRDLIMQALVKVGMRVTTKTAARLVPVAGQAVSAGLSYSAMRFVGAAPTLGGSGICRLTPWHHRAVGGSRQPARKGNGPEMDRIAEKSGRRGGLGHPRLPGIREERCRTEPA